MSLRAGSSSSSSSLSGPEVPFLVPAKTQGQGGPSPQGQGLPSLGLGSRPFLAPSSLSAFSVSSLGSVGVAGLTSPPRPSMRPGAFRVPLGSVRMAGDGSEEGSAASEDLSEEQTKELLELQGGDGEQDLRQRLLVQSEVNTELKRMLVASFGSDVAYRFERLAWDRSQFKHRSETLEEYVFVAALFARLPSL